MDIEELFRSKLQGTEFDPGAGAWEAIQSKMNLSNAASTTAAAAKTGLGLGKIAAIVSIAAGTGLGIGYLAFKNKPEQTPVTQNANTKQETNTVNQNQLPANVELTEINSVNKPDKIVSIVEVKKGNETQKVLVEIYQPANNKAHSVVGQWISKDNDQYSQDLIKKLVDQLENDKDNPGVSANNIINNDVLVQKISDNEVIAGIKVNTASGNVPLSVEFSNLTAATEYEWNFGDINNNTSREPNPTHVYNAPGNYVVSLIIKDANGKTYKDQLFIEVKESNQAVSSEAIIQKVPNVFTPNSDNISDVYKITGKDVESFHMIITDQRGKTVFTSNDINTGWDGTDGKGNNYPEGTYICVYSAKGNKQEKSGREMILLQRTYKNR